MCVSPFFYCGFAMTFGKCFRGPRIHRWWRVSGAADATLVHRSHSNAGRGWGRPVTRKGRSRTRGCWLLSRRRLEMPVVQVEMMKPRLIKPYPLSSLPLHSHELGTDIHNIAHLIYVGEQWVGNVQVASLRYTQDADSVHNAKYTCVPPVHVGLVVYSNMVNLQTSNICNKIAKQSWLFTSTVQ